MTIASHHALRLARLAAIAAPLLATSICFGADFSSYATMLQNNAARQSILNAQMFPLGSTSSTGSGGSTSPPPPCMPPFELQRGVDGHVPPELQGDPRYQAYLRCKQGQATPQTAVAPPPANAGSRSHLPITATDFQPVLAGHPVVDQAIAELAIAPEQRLQLRSSVDEMFRRVADGYRGNNVAVAIAVAYATANLALTGTDMTERQTRRLIQDVNDRLARNPRFAAMSAAEKQNNVDRLIFQTVVIGVLRDLGTREPQARQQSVELARVVMKQLNGA